MYLIFVMSLSLCLCPMWILNEYKYSKINYFVNKYFIIPKNYISALYLEIIFSLNYTYYITFVRDMVDIQLLSMLQHIGACDTSTAIHKTQDSIHKEI